MRYKEIAARRALEFVTDGMVVGLGSGSTTSHFIHLLAERLRSGNLRDVLGVPTSNATRSLAQTLGIPLTTLSESYQIDLAVDGADEVDPHLGLIKGLGRALLREKIVEVHAQKFLVIVDETKLVSRLGTKGPLPVEIVPFEWQATVRWLKGLNCQAELWIEQGAPIVTDNGNYLVRCWFPHSNHLQGIDDPCEVALQLEHRPGVVEHGLFLDMADSVIVAGPGGIEIMERQYER